MRLAFRGTSAAFERWISSDAPVELGRHTPELDAQGNTRISRCQLKLRLANGKVLLESCGANPTGIRRSGLWEWVLKGETRPLGMGDSVALSCTGKGDNRTPDTVLSCSAAVAITAAPARDEPAPAATVLIPTASVAGPAGSSRLLEAMLAEEPRHTTSSHVIARDSSSHETGLGLPKKSLASIMVEDDDDESWLLGAAPARGSSSSAALPGAAGSRPAPARSVDQAGKPLAEATAPKHSSDLTDQRGDAEEEMEALPWDETPPPPPTSAEPELGLFELPAGVAWQVRRGKYAPYPLQAQRALERHFAQG